MGMENIKLIVSDLDGTLLSPDGTVSRRNLEAILKLRSKGILFSIASGRMDRMYREYVRLLNIEIPVIACSGSVIRDLGSNEMIYKRTFKVEAALEAMKFYKENRMDYMAYTEDKVYFTSYSKRIEKFHKYNQIALKGGSEAMDLVLYEDDHEEIARSGIVKILLCGINKGDIEKAAEFTNKLEGVETVYSETNALDILPRGTSKGEALKKLAEKLCINLSEVCVFGDYINDISMMKTAGFSVAMGNAHDLVKQAAAVVTDSNSSDGVAKAIENYIL